ncbi:MAG TPA: glycosyltransferase family 2 protein [Bacteroidaceae bacterium]|nr:glycosyltransferase family 2 protein [Bacteroidaceae bacterium]
MKKISILIPCYNEEASLPLLYKELVKLMNSHSNYAWEILMINDGSKDRTLEIIKDLRKKDNRICYADLSRNFGKEKAMLAGFDYVTGDCMVIMDADLQHPPYIVNEMITKWESGYDDIYAKRKSRGKEPWLRKQLSLLFYKILQKTTKIEILPNVGDFRLLDRKCIESLKQLRETERYTKGMYCWIGYKKTAVEFEQQDRQVGQSSWNFLSLLSLAIEGIVSFTTFPLKIATLIGVFTSLCAFIYMIYVIIKAILFGDPVSGFPTLLSIMLFLGGIQLLALGIIGEYIGRVFHETKNRPVYIVREYNNEIILIQHK